jgi:protein-S-isoprenylcysteine O-methyltransferase Ste14
MIGEEWGRGGRVEMKTLIQGIPYLGTGLILFTSAGTFHWPQAWVFLALCVGGGLAIGAWLKRTNPELLAERTKSPLDYQERPRDRLISIGIMSGMSAWLVLMGLDVHRFRWSETPYWLQVAGAVLIVGAFAGWANVMRENSFAAAEVRVQEERGQTVISTGPYAIVRHPMYAYAILLIVGTAFLLGSLWGLLGLLVLMPLLGLRAMGEEAVLKNGLPGYREYTKQVRHRLVPGIW